MKPLTRTLIVLCLLMCGSAFADTIIGFYPNSGGGDNFTALIRIGNGDSVRITGGTDPFYYNAFGYPPGSSLGGPTPLFIDGGVARLGGQTYTLQQIGNGSFDMTTFTLPTTGNFFQVPVTIDFDVPMIIIETGDPYDVSGSASGYLSFIHSDVDGLYYGSPFSTPEPNTIVMLSTGLLGAAGVARKKLRIYDRLQATR